MTRVNLLPPEVRKERRDAALAHRIRFVALCLVLLLGGTYALRTTQLYLVDRDLRDVQAAQAVAQERLATLADVAAERDAVAAGRTLTATLLRGEVLWSQELLRVSTAIPGGFRLSTYGGQLLAEGAVPGIVGSVTFTATADTLIPTEAWLVRIAAQEAWANGWVNSAVQADGGIFTVNGSYDLTNAALSPRAGGQA